MNIYETIKSWWDDTPKSHRREPISQRPAYPASQPPPIRCITQSILKDFEELHMWVTECPAADLHTNNGNQFKLYRVDRNYEIWMAYTGFYHSDSCSVYSKQLRTKCKAESEKLAHYVFNTTECHAIEQAYHKFLEYQKGQKQRDAEKVLKKLFPNCYNEMP